MSGFFFRPAPGLAPPRPPMLLDFVGTFSPSFLRQMCIRDRRRKGRDRRSKPGLPNFPGQRQMNRHPIYPLASNAPPVCPTGSAEAVGRSSLRRGSASQIRRPVSYTHLDVYKRQQFTRRAGTLPGAVLCQDGQRRKPQHKSRFCGAKK